MQILPNDPCGCKFAKLATTSDRTMGGVLVGDRRGGDGTMGADSDQRLVGLQVSGNFSLLSLPFYVEKQRVQDALVADNWNVLDVRQVDGSVVSPTWRTFQIFANVYNRHSDNDVAASANRVLSGLMSNLKIELLRNPDAVYTDGNKATDWLAEFWKGLGITAAPSAAVTILGGGIIFLILTRR